MILPPLYHWSPIERHDNIREHGLQIFSESPLAAVDPTDSEAYVINWPWLCFGTNAADAWQLSGGMDWEIETETWDLWQVTLADTDEVHIKAEFGTKIKEVRVHNTIPVDRVWWIAARPDNLVKQRKDS